ncbi:hypothetical protein [Nocardia vinacea]|uniref:hypothetical protein n=1 Tax=Nocardia vinacea TaxID=96468 RepID=UPI0012F6DDF9|nr:hypothetical protein [Nocardia vinacea]
MTMEIVVGMVIAWAISKARRVGKHLDGRTDQALDAAADRVWDVVSRKLGMHPAIQRLVDEATETGAASEVTRRQAQHVLEEAASNDPGFGAELNAALMRPSPHVATGAVTNTGTMQGGVMASQITGRTVRLKASNKTVNQAITYTKQHPRPVLFGGILLLVIVVFFVSCVATGGDDNRSSDGRNERIPTLIGGVTSPMPATTTFSSTVQSGILVHFTSGKGSNGIRNKETIGFLNPSTGQYQKYREFDITGWTGYFYSYELVFSPTLDRYAMSKVVDGQGHAGWVEASGKFTDVTAGQKPGPFEEGFAFDSIGFGRNGDFYYARVSTDRKFDVYRLPSGATSGAQLIKTLGPFATVRAWREGDGTIGVYGSGDDSPEGNCEYSFGNVSWVSPNTYVIGGGTQIYKVVNVTPACPKEALLPSSNRATVTNPVVSSDGKRVVFVYNDIDLYTVDLSANSVPVKLEYPKDTLRGFQLLRWI